jgi:hypothetical protein
MPRTYIRAVSSGHAGAIIGCPDVAGLRERRNPSMTAREPRPMVCKREVAGSIPTGSTRGSPASRRVSHSRGQSFDPFRDSQTRGRTRQHPILAEGECSQPLPLALVTAHRLRVDRQCEFVRRPNEIRLRRQGDMSPLPGVVPGQHVAGQRQSGQEHPGAGGLV